MIHTITVVPARKMDGGQFWRWRCSGSKTGTSIWGYIGQAEGAGLAHKKAKEKNPS